MSTIARKVRLFEEHSIPTEGNGVLHAEMMLPKAPMRARRVVFIPPLVGGGAAQALLIFRNLTRRGSILLSFEYRGHPRSTGVFDLDGTVADVRHALLWAWDYAQQRGLPLHGLTLCYGTVPLLAQFKQGGCGTLLKSFCAASGLFRMDHILRLEEIAAALSRCLGEEVSAAELLQRTAGEELDWRGDTCRRALRDYLSGLFPQLHVGLDAFEELRYDRADLGRVLLQFAQARYLEDVCVPPWIPCHFLFGRNDEMMALDTTEGQAAYRRHVRGMIPHAALHECDVDHFGRGPGREALIDHVGDVNEQSDGNTVPAHHFNLLSGVGGYAHANAASVLE